MIASSNWRDCVYYERLDDLVTKERNESKNSKINKADNLYMRYWGFLRRSIEYKNSWKNVLDQNAIISALRIDSIDPFYQMLNPLVDDFFRFGEFGDKHRDLIVAFLRSYFFDIDVMTSGDMLFLIKSLEGSSNILAELIRSRDAPSARQLVELRLNVETALSVAFDIGKYAKQGKFAFFIDPKTIGNDVTDRLRSSVTNIFEFDDSEKWRAPYVHVSTHSKYIRLIDVIISGDTLEDYANIVSEEGGIASDIADLKDSFDAASIFQSYIVKKFLPK
jgi:hypothetical protein